MSSDDLEVKIGADSSGLKSGMDEAAEAVKSGMGSIQSALDSVTAGFFKFNMAIEAIKNVFEGGKFFGAAIHESMQLNISMENLSMRLALTHEAAWALGDTLEAIGSSGEAYGTAVQRMTQKMTSNESAFTSNHIAVRNLDRTFRDSGEVLQDTIAKIKDMGSAHDKAAAGLALLGRNWAQQMVLGRASKEAIEETRKAHEALGYVVTTQSVESTYKYMAALNDAGDVFKAVGLHIANDMMPKLTALAEWFASVGPSVVEASMAAFEMFQVAMEQVKGVASALWEVLSEAFSGIGSIIGAVFGAGGQGFTAMDAFKIAMLMVADAVIIMRAGFETGIEAIRGILEVAGALIGRWAASVSFMLKLDFAGAQAAWKAGTAGIEKIASDSNARLVAIQNKAQVDMDAAAARAAGVTKDSIKAKKDPAGAGGDSKWHNPKEDGEAASELAFITAQLNAQTALRKEQAAEVKRILDDQYKNDLIDVKAYYEEKTRIEQEELQKEIDAKETEKAGAKQKLADAERRGVAGNKEKMQIMAQIAKLIGETDVLSQKQLNVEDDNNRKLTNELKKRRDEMQKITIEQEKGAGLSDISILKTHADEALALGRMTAAESIAIQQELEDRKYAIIQKALFAEEALAGADEVKKATAQKNELAAYQEHMQKMAELSKEAAIESGKYWNDMWNGMGSGFTSTFAKILNGQLSFHNSMKQLMLDISNAVVNSLAKMVSDWAIASARKLFISKAETAQEVLTGKAVLGQFSLVEASKTKIAAAGAAERALIDAAGVAESGIAAMFYIANAAAVAGANGVASFALAPWPIDMGAPEFGASMSDAALTFASGVAGFEVGTDYVPRTGYALLHEGEKVIPKSEQGAPYSGVGGGDVHLHVHSLDVSGVKDWFKKNSNTLAPGLRNLARNFTPVKP